jgi:hypothetical protein
MNTPATLVDHHRVAAADHRLGLEQSSRARLGAPRPRVLDELNALARMRFDRHLHIVAVTGSGHADDADHQAFFLIKVPSDGQKHAPEGIAIYTSLIDDPVVMLWDPVIALDQRLFRQRDPESRGSVAGSLVEIGMGASSIGCSLWAATRTGWPARHAPAGRPGC